MASWAGARSLCATLVVLVGAAATAPAAWSTFPGLNQSFPGLNGHLAYEARSGASTNIFSIQPLAGESGQRTQLTDGRATDRDAAWHPDGQQIAFTSDRDGNDEIYLKGAEPSARPRRLTIDPAADTDPTFSPDGTQLAFTSTRDGNPELYVMAIDGSAQRRLTVDPAVDQQADWSPDGTRIAFESNRDGDMDLYTMSPDGSAVTQLTFSPDFDADASWHPDGTRIAFVSGAGGALDIFTLRPGTDGRTRLTRGGDAHFPAWSPDGQQIAYTSYGETRVMKADAGAVATPAANGVDAAWGPLLLPPPVPEFKKTMNLETTTGTVFVRMKGAAGAAPLETEDAGEIPVGGARCDPDAPASTCTVIDTRQGELEIEAATTASRRSTISVAVSEGRATLSQDRAGVTVLRLPRQGCGAPPNRLRTRAPELVAAASASSAPRKKKRRKKRWATQDDKNKYATNQTDFTTARTCNKTTIRVREGVVEVTNLKTGRRVGFVREGRSRSFAAR
jgi:WD40-like Beta Propeller Repeat